MLHGPNDVHFEERPDPAIIESTDAILRMTATCVCGSDLWPYLTCMASPTAGSPSKEGL